MMWTTISGTCKKKTQLLSRLRCYRDMYWADLCALCKTICARYDGSPRDGKTCNKRKLTCRFAHCHSRTQAGSKCITMLRKDRTLLSSCFSVLVQSSDLFISPLAAAAARIMEQATTEKDHDAPPYACSIMGTSTSVEHAASHDPTIDLTVTSVNPRTPAQNPPGTELPLPIITGLTFKMHTLYGGWLYESHGICSMMISQPAFCQTNKNLRAFNAVQKQF